jgi:hypothetical protein
MYNPKTNLDESYVERWRRYAQPPGAAYCVLERQGEGIAYLGRVGSKALGLSKVGDEFVAWRDESEDGTWKRVYGAQGGLPRLPVEMPETWKEGELVSLGASEWIVRTVGTL